MKVKAGFGKVDITPRVGVELCGFGAYLNRHSTRVVEPLFARALAVEAGEARWVLVSCDLIGFNHALTLRIRKLVCEATGWRDDQIMIHATHTHSGPCTIPELIGWGDPDDPYLEILPRFVAKACIDAIGDLRAATFHHAEVEALGFSFNRELGAPGLTHELALNWQWKTEKPEETDTTAHVIRVDRDGRCAGFLSYFACHPVICCEQTNETHGDFVGVATNRVEKEYPGSVGLFLQGAQGDINPIYAHGPPDESLVALERFGARFAEVILSGIRSAKPFEVDRIASVLTDEPYTLTPVDEAALQAELAEKEAVLARATLQDSSFPTGSTMVCAKSLRLVLERHRRGESQHRPMPVQALRLGPITFTGFPLEVMHRIKRRFQAERGGKALLLSITNGFHGYAPLREYYQTPPYRYPTYFVPVMLGWVPFTPDFEDEVLAAALKVTQLV